MRRRLRVPILLGVGLFAALLAAAAFSNAAVSFRAAQQAGDRVAEVLIGDRVVMVLRTEAGEYMPLERAEIVASRLRAALAERFEPGDVQVHPVVSGYALYIGGHLIAASYENEAAAQGSDPEALATQWRDNILLALGLEKTGTPAGSGPPPSGEPDQG